MAKKLKPHSVLDVNGGLAQKYPDWAEKIQGLIEGKPVHSVQFRFYVDGYRFYQDCEHEAKRQAGYVRWLFDNWSKKPVPDLPINSDVLAAVGRQILQRAERCIAERFIEMGAATGQTFILATDVAVDAVGKITPDIVERVNEASAILDPFYTVDIYAAKQPSVDDFQRRIKYALKYYRGTKGDSGWKRLEENYRLVEEGRYKNRFGTVRDFSEYEQFISQFEGGKAMEQTHLALCRYGAGDDGGLWQKEKGVDAMLFMGLFDAKNDPDTDAICLFSNDSDYYPILDRIKEETPRPLFLAVLDDGKSVSKMLRRAVGDDFVVKVKTNFLPWQKIAESREFMAAQDLNRMLEYEAEMEAKWEVIEAELDAHFGLTPDKAPDEIE